MKGKILWFNNHKGYGEIECEKGERYFLTYQDIQGSSEYKTISTNINVSFSKSNEILFDSYRAVKVCELDIKKKINRNNRKVLDAI